MFPGSLARDLLWDDEQGIEFAFGKITRAVPDKAEVSFLLNHSKLSSIQDARTLSRCLLEIQWFLVGTTIILLGDNNAETTPGRRRNRSRIEDGGLRMGDRGLRMEDRGLRMEDRGLRVGSSTDDDPLSSILHPRSSSLDPPHSRYDGSILSSLRSSPGQTRLPPSPFVTTFTWASMPSRIGFEISTNSVPPASAIN